MTGQATSAERGYTPPLSLRLARFALPTVLLIFIVFFSVAASEPSD